MDDRQKPDPQTENANDTSEEGIIDLTQVSASEDEETIIDLDNVLEPADPANGDLEETVIPLTDALAAQPNDDQAEEILDLTDLTADPADPALASAIDAPAEAEETIIDLMDVSAPFDAETGTVPPSPAAVDSTQADEETVIDLTDMAPPAESVDAAEPAPADGAPLAVESEEEIVLFDTVDEPTAAAGSEAETLNAEADQASVVPSAVDSDAATMLIDTLEEMDEEDPPVAETVTTDTDATQAEELADVAPADAALAPTEAQVEATLERVITKIYGEKIEQMMIRTIEKTVRQEIEKIKSTLIDADGDAAD